MSNQEQIGKVLEGIAELKGTVKSMSTDIASIKSDVRTNTTDLTEHKLGVITIREEIKKRDEDLKLFEARLTEVEFLPNLAKSLWKVMKVVGGIAATAVAVSKFLGMW